MSSECSELFSLCVARRWHEAIHLLKTDRSSARLLNTGKRFVQSVLSKKTKFVSTSSYDRTLHTIRHLVRPSKRIFPHILFLRLLICSHTYVRRGAARISALQCVLAHSQCRGDCPLELIQALVDSDPRMADQKHLYTGSVPLHAAFYNAFFTSSKRTAIAKILLTASPQSVAARNNEGRTALHTNASQHCNYEPTLLLLKAAPEITRWTDHNGDLPLHCACRSHKSPSKVRRQVPS
mmetsp:Transcript_828/g.2289  ORF Transcript_828/g.2289 Transcript_828/m.2289 type:complete len:237 (-) Transcript_828:2411-3121(-)